MEKIVFGRVLLHVGFLKVYFCGEAWKAYPQNKAFWLEKKNPVVIKGLKKIKIKNGWLLITNRKYMLSFRDEVIIHNLKVKNIWTLKTITKLSAEVTLPTVL